LAIDTRCLVVAGVTGNATHAQIAERPDVHPVPPFPRTRGSARCRWKEGSGGAARTAVLQASAAAAVVPRRTNATAAC